MLHVFLQHISIKFSFVSERTIIFGTVKTGWTSFTVCGKLRRIVKVKKVLTCRHIYLRSIFFFMYTYAIIFLYLLLGMGVGLQVGHAGTLDPMATGLLIVCVGKATKLVER